MSGRSLDEIRGRDCRFLQGENAGVEHVIKIKQSLEAENALEVILTNYKFKKNSAGIIVPREFQNELFMEPLDDRYFVGTQKDVTQR